MIRVGVVGTGFGRVVHIPGFQRVAGVSVAGLASRNARTAQSVADEAGVPHVFATWQELIASDQIDVVAIATPPAAHAPIAFAAITAGKSVLCEKPLALDVATAAAMRDAANAAGVVHFTGFEFREIEALALARRCLQARVCGDVRHVDVRWIVNSWANPDRPWSWRADAGQGGGTLGALGAHVFDYLEWMVGPVRAVMARLDVRVRERPDPEGRPRAVSAEDYGDISLELSNGTPVNVLLSMVASQNRAHSIEVHGTKGALTITHEAAEDYGRGFALWQSQTGSKTRRLISDAAERTIESGQLEDGRIALFARLAGRFIDAVRSKNLNAQPSFQEGARAQLLIDLARRASRERRWISTAEAGIEI